MKTSIQLDIQRGQIATLCSTISEATAASAHAIGGVQSAAYRFKDDLEQFFNYDVPAPLEFALGTFINDMDSRIEKLNENTRSIQHRLISANIGTASAQSPVFYDTAATQTSFTNGEMNPPLAGSPVHTESHSNDRESNVMKAQLPDGPSNGQPASSIGHAAPFQTADSQMQNASRDLELQRAKEKIKELDKELSLMREECETLVKVALERQKKLHMKQLSALATSLRQDIMKEAEEKRAEAESIMSEALAMRESSMQESVRANSLLDALRISEEGIATAMKSYVEKSERDKDPLLREINELREELHYYQQNYPTLRRGSASMMEQTAASHSNQYGIDNCLPRTPLPKGASEAYSKGPDGALSRSVSQPSVSHSRLFRLSNVIDDMVSDVSAIREREEVLQKARKARLENDRKNIAMYGSATLEYRTPFAYEGMNSVHELQGGSTQVPVPQHTGHTGKSGTSNNEVGLHVSSSDASHLRDERLQTVHMSVNPSANIYPPVVQRNYTKQSTHPQSQSQPVSSSTVTNLDRFVGLHATGVAADLHLASSSSISLLSEAMVPGMSHIGGVLCDVDDHLSQLQLYSRSRSLGEIYRITINNTQSPSRESASTQDVEQKQSST